VGEHVCVGVAMESLLERDLHSTEDEPAPRIGEGVGVYA
jgi:hypothetical protein